MKALRLLLCMVAWASAVPATAADDIYIVRIEGGISSATADYVDMALQRAQDEGASALLITLDTPGGTLGATKDIVSSLLNAEVPVIVYVSPRGAWAASAGTFITMAAHVAAMAPGTSIGAAHPVFQGQGPTLPPVTPEEREKQKEGEGTAPRERDYVNEKIENMTAAFIESIAEERERNVDWAIEAVRDSVAIKGSEAVEKNVVDLVAKDLDELLAAIDGREVSVDGESVKLATADATQVEVEMTGFQKFLAFLAIPQVAFILLLGAAAGIYIEVQSPGLIVPGAIGVVCAILLGISLQIIPFDWVGLILMVLGIGLLIAELFFTSFGLLFAGGVVLFAIGAYMTFSVPEISDVRIPFWSFVAPVTALFAALFGFALWAVSRTFSRPQYFGREGLVGALVVADDDFDREGRVSFRGEYWKAISDAPAARGDRLEIVAVDNLVLRVRPAPDGASKEA